MRTLLLVLSSILGGLAIVALAFCGTAALVGYLYLLWESRTSPYDGQGGISAAILGLIAGIPAALAAGYLWMSFCLDRFAKMGIIPIVRAKPY
jgi:hypothetical protein